MYVHKNTAGVNGELAFHCFKYGKKEILNLETWGFIALVLQFTWVSLNVLQMHPVEHKVEAFNKQTVSKKKHE